MTGTRNILKKWCEVELNYIEHDLYRCTVHSKIYAIHTQTNALFIKIGKFTLKYTSISLLHISAYDHHQGACYIHFIYITW